MDDYESVCLVKPEIFIYRIPPQASNKGHKYGIRTLFFNFLFYLLNI